MEKISTSAEVGGAGGAYSYSALKRVDQLWQSLCSAERGRHYIVYLGFLFMLWWLEVFGVGTSFFSILWVSITLRRFLAYKQIFFFFFPFADKQKVQEVVSSFPGSYSQLNLESEAANKFDVIVCGGTLGIFIATALSLKGLKVGIVERNLLKGVFVMLIIDSAS